MRKDDFAGRVKFFTDFGSQPLKSSLSFSSVNAYEMSTDYAKPIRPKVIYIPFIE
jgi:hypothetical protein